MGGAYWNFPSSMTTLFADDVPQEAKQVLGDKFELVTAFSREGPKKVYVQHRLKERAKEVNELLQQKAYFYVCGDAANMAREVNAVLAQILSAERGIPEAKGEEIVKQMRQANQYQVCSPLSSRLPGCDQKVANLSDRRMCGRKRISYCRRFWLLYKQR